MSEAREKCECCHGSGQLVCGTCHGAGTQLMVVRGVEDEEWDVCPECLGRKMLPCPECRGAGTVAADRNVA
jgi:DnaJ-class molecular chaperone